MQYGVRGPDGKILALEPFQYETTRDVLQRAQAIAEEPGSTVVFRTVVTRIDAGEWEPK